MLLVTFHGSSTGITNVYGLDTTTGSLNTPTALHHATLTNAELRGLVYANSYLYVINGAKGASNILCFQPPAAGAATWNFNYVSEFIAPTLSNKGHFKNSIGHPYAMQFDGSGVCYITNQDTNVVAQAQVASNFQTATIATGCQSQYLTNLTSLCPSNGCTYLDGTYVASQVGALPDVDTPAPVTDVPSQYGGLSVNPPANITTVQNSVRDVAIFDSVLLVCDEPSNLIRLYSLPDGAYLGSSATLPIGPTHLAIFSNGLYVSVGNQLYWSPLITTPTPMGLDFQSVLTAPSSYDVGGVAFDSSSGTAYVAFQDGKGETGSGVIYSYTLGNLSVPLSPPVFGAGTNLTPTALTDTPEFLLFMPNP